MSHFTRPSHAPLVLRLLIAAVLSGWIAGPTRAEEEEIVEEEEPAAAPAPQPAAKPAATPTTPSPTAAKPATPPAEEPEAVEPETAEAAEPASVPADAAEPAAEPAEAAAPADEPAAEGEAEGEEGLEVADEPAAAEAPAPSEPAKPAAPAPVTATAPAAEAAEEGVEEEVAAPAPEPEPVVADAEPVVEPEVSIAPTITAEPPPMPVWNARAQEAGFTDFLRAGIPMDPVNGTRFTARVAGATDGFREGSVQGEQLFVTGAHPAGKVFAVYRAAPGSRLARYVGLVATLRPAAGDRTRAVVMRSGDLMTTGDGLVAIDEARAEFDRERTRAMRESGTAGEAAGMVVCFHDDREIQTQPDDVLLVNRGSRDGITLAWVCEMPQDGSERVSAYGRVVRTGPDSCLVRVLKSYQPVRTGIPARLASRPASDRARAGSGR